MIFQGSILLATASSAKSKTSTARLVSPLETGLSVDTRATVLSFAGRLKTFDENVLLANYPPFIMGASSGPASALRFARIRD
jgi:hypothetical protein